MPLDLAKVAAQLTELGPTFRQHASQNRFDALRDAYEQVDDDDLRKRIQTARTSWLLARAEGSFHATSPCPGTPATFGVVATDGSFIPPDRHGPIRFHLLNIGRVRLEYGSACTAELSAEPTLYLRDEDLYVPNDLRRVPVDGNLLGLKRAGEELRAAAELALSSDVPSVVLQDGTLILWALEGQPDFILDWALPPFLDALRGLQAARIPVSAYISRPASSDVLNTLRVAVCDYPPAGRPVNCDHCRSRIATEGHVPACDILPDTTDRVVFAEIARLQPGERSQVFASSSKILDRYDSDLRVDFFYFNTGTEIARVEVPRWVATNPTLLDQTHAIIADQCERGRGYPVALQEAHELAVIKQDDRRMMEVLVEEALLQLGITPKRSAKDGSKRGRYV